MDGASVQLANEGGQIGGMGRCRIGLPCVRPGGGTMIAVGVGNEAVLLRYGLALRLPEAKVGEGAMHKHDWRARTFVEVGEIDAIHTELTRLWGFSGPGLQGKGTTEQNDDCQP